MADQILYCAEGSAREVSTSNSIHCSLKLHTFTFQTLNSICQGGGTLAMLQTVDFLDTQGVSGRTCAPILSLQEAGNSGAPNGWDIAYGALAHMLGKSGAPSRRRSARSQRSLRVLEGN